MLSKEAVSILRKVRLHILAEPKRLNMSQWIKRTKVRTSKQTDNFAQNVPKYSFPRCNTAGCIAGWTVLLHDGMKKKIHHSEVSSRGAELLGLTGIASDLFYVDSWDEPWSHKYRAATTPAAKAKIAGAYINHYIKTRGSNADTRG